MRFWPDRQVFVAAPSWSFEPLVQRARQTAYLVPGLTIRIRDERSDADRSAPASPDVAADWLTTIRRDRAARGGVPVRRRDQRVLRAT